MSFDRYQKFDVYDSNQSFDLIGPQNPTSSEQVHLKEAETAKIERTLRNNQKFALEISNSGLSRYLKNRHKYNPKNLTLRLEQQPKRKQSEEGVRSEEVVAWTAADYKYQYT